MKVKLNRAAGMAALSIAMLGAVSASATDYYWTRAGGNDNWTTTANWNPNSAFPKAGDRAFFTGTVDRTVNIAAGSQTADTVNVTGSARWIFAIGTNVLFLNGGNFEYASTASATSTCSAILGGTGGMVISNGALNVYNISNFFAGDIEINGGQLLQAQSGQEPSTNDFGLTTKTIYLGATTAGTNDAALYISDKNVSGTALYQPIVVRSGNAGKATIGMWNRQDDKNNVASTVTLQKPVTIFNPLIRANYVMIQKSLMRMNSAISGSGSVTKEGIGAVSLSASNSYTGATIMDGGLLWLGFTNNGNVGDVTVRKGTLIHNRDGALGVAANTVTLGGPGGLGWLAANSSIAVATNSRSIILDGVGGALFTRNNNSPCMDGVISGPGRLFIVPTYTAYLNNNNTYSGGTYVVDGTADIQGSGNYGKRAYGYSTNVFLNYNANMVIRSNANLSANAKVFVGNRGRLTLATDYVPTIDTSSAGTLALAVNSGPAFNARMADAGSPIGNGKMTLFLNMDCKFTGADLSALAGHDPGHTYRVTGTAGGGQGSFLDTATTTGALKDLLATPYDVSVGGGLRSRDNHGFTGRFIVRNGASFWGYVTPDVVTGVMGHVNGPVSFYGNTYGTTPETVRIISEGNGVAAVDKGDLAVAGEAYLWLDASATMARTVTVTFASITRTNRSVLGLAGVQNMALGGREKAFVTSGITTNSGMVPPWLWQPSTWGFMNYGPNGFVYYSWDKTNLALAVSGDKVNMTAAEALPAAGVSVYGLKSGYAISANGAAVLTNENGGMILWGNDITHTAPMTFGTNEAVIITPAANDKYNALTGPISGTNGLTKAGLGQLRLLGTNDLYGDITVTDGRLTIDKNLNLGSTNNTIVLAGGLLYVTANVAITNPIYLADGLDGYMGSIGSAEFKGKISGPGPLQCSYYAHGSGVYGYKVSNSLNDYTGGTYVYNAVVNVTSSGKLGNGPVYIGGSSGGTTGNAMGGVDSYGDDNFSTNHTITQATFSGGLWFNSSNPRIGSLEGNGMAILMTDNSRLTTGYDNQDTDYFGQIMENYNTTKAKLVKVGAGTFTVWGENTYSGGTEVSNGTLRVMNWINPAGPVLVRPGATLDGEGTVGVVSNLGGTVKGNLHMRRLFMDDNATLAVTISGTNAASQYGQLYVSEGVSTLNGTLQVTLNGFTPLADQKFVLIQCEPGASVTGTFNDGQTLSGVVNGRSYTFAVSTTGGDGNDLELTALQFGTIIMTR